MEAEVRTESRQELEQWMDVNAVFLLREAHDTDDVYLRQRLFEQAADQEASLMSEVLEGAVATDFKFESHDGKLYLLQPRGVTDWQLMHQNGVLRAEAKAAEDPQFGPYVEMAAGELEESRLQETMVAAGEPAVMAKLSLCGDDVMSTARLKMLGRDPDLRRAYLRVSVFDGKDMHIHSRSIDGVSLSAGHGFATGWGTWEQPQMELEAGASSVDILKNQLYFDEAQMSIEQMHQLADKLVGAFDWLQAERTGLPHKAGRAPEGVDTYKFVLANDDLLTAHMGSLYRLAGRRDLPVGHLAAMTNDLRYDIMSSFKQRLEGSWVDLGSLGDSVAAAGDAERALGTQFGGCDTVVSANVAEASGYVNARAPGQAERAKMIKQLREKSVGKGSCSACGAGGKLFGCGLCASCNKKWCDIYEKFGKQTPINDLARFKPSRGERPLFKTETFGEYWARLGREEELKKLQREAELAEAA